MNLSKEDYADRTPCPLCLRSKPRKFFVCSNCYSEMPEGWRREVWTLRKIVDPDGKNRKARSLMGEARLVIEAKNNRLGFPSEV